HDGCLASSGGGNVFAIEQDGLDFGNIAEARHAVACEVRILYPAVFEFDSFEECAAQPLNHRSDHLVAQTIRVDDGAAFERFNQTHDAHRAGGLVHRHFSKF